MIISMYNEYEHTIVITNRALVQGDFLMQLKKVLQLHPNALILREKDLTEKMYEDLAEKVLDLCNQEKVRCFLHSRIEAARRLKCKNIHLSIPTLQKMTDTERMKLRSDFSEISVSCHSTQDVQYAVELRATQIILGTIFETECKKGLKGKGVKFVREVCNSCDLPVYAIGGINLERVELVRKAGAAGGCMMSGFMRM